MAAAVLSSGQVYRVQRARGAFGYAAAVERMIEWGWDRSSLAGATGTEGNPLGRQTGCSGSSISVKVGCYPPYFGAFIEPVV